MMAHDGEFWRWVEAAVDQERDHLRLVHDASDAIVALVGKPEEEGTFLVELLVQDEHRDPAAEAALEDVQRELDFYLLEVGGPNAWEYAIYHSRTMANVYGSIHWGFVPAGQMESERWSGIPKVRVEGNPFDPGNLIRIGPLGDEEKDPLAEPAASTGEGPANSAGPRVALFAGHALIRGLRQRGSEVELTQALASVFATEPRMAAAFVRLVFGAAPHRERVDLDGLPDRLVAQAEQKLVEGRADLIFVDESGRWRVIEQVMDETLDLGQRPGAARPGRKLLTLVASALVGGDSIDDADVLRCGETERVLAHRVMAPSTLGTFLRSFTFGHVRQLDRACETILRRAWAAGAGPGCEPLTIDLDSTVVEVAGEKKQGASFAYTKCRGYHPLLATRADTGEVLHARMRKGSASTQRGAERFVRELVARVRRLGASGRLTVRADSGFWSYKTIEALEGHGVRYSIGVTQQTHVREAIAQIPEQAWKRLADYPPEGIAEIAESTLGGRRLVVRRTRLVGAQAELFPDWRHHAFITDCPEPLAQVEAEHRRHAQIELAIRDLNQPRSLRPLLRQRRLATRQLPRAQSPPLDRPPRPAAARPDRRANAPPPLPDPARSHHPQRQAGDAPSAGPLALARALRDGAHATAGAAAARLSQASAP